MLRFQRFATWMVGLAFAFGTAAFARAEDNAVIKGKVLFNGDKEKYKRTELDTTKDAKCTKKVGSWEVQINKTEPPTLRYVIVSIKEGLGDRKFTAPATAALLDQSGCEYTPHVLAVMEGQEVKIRNSDDTNHNIHFLPKVNEEFNKTQPKQNMEDTIKLKAEDPIKVKCDVHPWMGCHVAVFKHPYFFVTDKEGTFEIKGLPAGKYVVEAWHEKFGTQTMAVEVTTGQTVEKDFTYAPK